MWQAWINILLGIWVFFSGFWYVLPWNFFTSGFLIAFFGFWTFRGQWQGLLNGILGIWLIVSAFSAMFMIPWNLWITGIFVTVLAIWRTVAFKNETPGDTMP